MPATAEINTNFFIPVFEDKAAQTSAVCEKSYF